MILIKFVPVLFIINSVSSGIVLHKGIESVTREVRDAYKYNHPPSAEYFAVPVSVVYEEGNRKEKSLVSNVSTAQNSDIEASSTERLRESDTASTTISDSKDSEETNSEFSTDAPRSKDVSVAQGKEISEESIGKATENTPLNKKYSEDELNSTTTEATLLLENHAKSGPNKISEKITSSPVEDNDDDDVKILYNEKNDFASQENYENPKIRVEMPHDGLIIPVAVVYDVEPEYLRKRNSNRVTVKADTITKQQRDKNTEKLSNNEKDVSKPAEEDKNTRESIKSASFPKRSEGRDPIVPIIQSENYVFSHSGDFHYSYEGADGTKAFERGALSDTAGEAVEGSFSYVGKDGKDYSLTYTADENGYRPSGAHLPTPPPIPPAIARALKYLATKATTETVTERLH